MKRWMWTAIAATLFSGAVLAQDKEPAKPAGERVSPIAKYILDMFQEHEGNTLCSVGNVPVSAFEERVLKELGKKSGDVVPQVDLERALWTLFPCPFSPLRPELLPAGAKDLEGAWIFPYSSQPYRFGPKSPLQPKTAEDAVACELIGYYPGGEYREGLIRGASSRGEETCAKFTMASDMDAARKRPRVQNWAMPANGQLRVTRTDQKDYVEEWDVYSVTRSFQALNMEVKAGDLVAFKRREKGLNPGISIEFRHLQRLK